MKEENKTAITPLRIDVPFSEQEKAEFKSFLRRTGRKAGPWIYSIALSEIKKERVLAGSGSSEVLG